MVTGRPSPSKRRTTGLVNHIFELPDELHGAGDGIRRPVLPPNKASKAVGRIKRAVSRVRKSPSRVASRSSASCSSSSSSPTTPRRGSPPTSRSGSPTSRPGKCRPTCSSTTNSSRPRRAPGSMSSTPRPKRPWPRSVRRDRRGGGGGRGGAHDLRVGRVAEAVGPPSRRRAAQSRRPSRRPVGRSGRARGPAEWQAAFRSEDRCLDGDRGAALLRRVGG